jgi:hypothetical protein
MTIKMKARRIRKRVVIVSKSGHKTIIERELTSKDNCDICNALNQHLNINNIPTHNMKDWKCSLGLARQNLKVHMATGLHWKFVNFTCIDPEGKIIE